MISTHDPADNEPHAPVSAAYRRFAEGEARGRSPLYQELATRIASDSDVIAFLLALPREKRQPNPLFACFRYCFGTPGDWHEFREGLLANRDSVRTQMLRRSTQTNEPARCAVLLRALARLPQPLALIEVGASAGLCLLPDLYAYDYDGQILRPAPSDSEAPQFPCAVNAAAAIPTIMPRIVWRAGLDLNPLDLTDPGDAAWLETLVWPEQTERLARFRAAMKIAADEKPCVIRGDLRTDLPQLAQEAPNATLVIFHTAVLAYLPTQAERDAFAASVVSFCNYWIANESPRLFSGIADRVGKEAPNGAFLLSVNGTPTARTDPHGAWLEWTA